MYQTMHRPLPSVFGLLSEGEIFKTKSKKKRGKWLKTKENGRFLNLPFWSPKLIQTRTFLQIGEQNSL